MTTEIKTVLTAEDRTTEAFRRMEQNASGAVSSINDKFASMKRAMDLAFLGVSINTAFSALKSFVTSTIELADKLHTTAVQTGMTVENLSALRYAAQQNEVDFDTLSTALVKFNRNIAEATNGNKTALSAFTQLGISLETVRSTKPEDLFKLVAQRISELAAETDRTKAEVDLFSRSGAALDPLFTEGAAGIDRATKAARELGVVIDTEANDKVRDLGDKADLLKSKWDAFATRMLGTVAPTVIRALDEMERQASRPYLENVFRTISGMNLVDDARALVGFGQPKTEPPAGAAGVINRDPPAKTRTLGKSQEELAKEAAAAAAAARKADADRKAAEAAQVQAWHATDGSNSAVNQWLQKTETDLQKAQRQAQEFEDTLIDLVAGGTITPDQAKMRWLEYLDKALPEVEVKMKHLQKTTNEMSVYAEQAARNMQDAFAAFLFDPFKGGLKGMLSGFVNTLRQMVAQAAAAKIFEALGIGGKTGLIATAFKLFGFADGGDPPVNRPSIVGERGPEIFIPKTAGTIVPTAQAAGMGGVNIGTVAPVYNISGLGLSYEQVVSLMARNNADLVSMLRNPRMR